MGAEPDFSGYATKANLKCSDGRTITADAFKHQDQMTVPLVWQHGHNDPTNVLGHAVLENRADGVYCHGYFNETPKGQSAKQLVQHNDVKSLSIYANQLVEKSKSVLHGMIREVSLVLAGANPGAFIDQVNIAHADGSEEVLEDEVVIRLGIPLEHSDIDEEEKEIPISHAAGAEKTVQDVFDTFSEEQKQVVYYLLGEATNSDSAAHSDEDDATVVHADEDMTIAEVFETLDDVQKQVVHFMIGEALTAAEEATTANADNSVAHSDTQEGITTVTNVFEKGATQGAEDKTLSHDALKGIIETADKRKTTFKNELQDYALSHGIDDIDILFPDAKAVTTAPEFLARRSEWVADIMTGTRHTPFSRIKSLLANLTYESARAKGYVKGSFKKEEFIRVSKRITVPTTVYKKQKLDRDDILDITDFDVVAWLKGEMRLMLEEEIARAVLLGDGRPVDDEDKINEENIRPIATDSDLYVTYLNVDLGNTASSADALVDSLVLNRRHYRGSGNPVMFTSETVLARLLLIKDTQGRRIYPTVTEVASALRVSKIVTVELMDEPTNDVLAVIVNPADYTIGADRGGDVALFDDFDIDYNQQKYLIETRLSGALTKPKSALVVRRVAAGTTLRTPASPSWNPTTHTVTIPTSTGVTYKNKANNATLTGTVTLVEDQEITVQAVPASGTDYLNSSAGDEWVFTYEDGLNVGVIA